MNSTTATPAISKRKIITLASVVALTPMAIDTYLPAIPSMAQDLNASIAITQSTVSVYLAGAAVGHFLGGPLSDLYGRKSIGIVGIIIFSMASILIAISTNINEVLALRFVQAIGGGAAVVIVGAMVRDTHTGKESAKMMALISVIMMTAPLVAPAIGALVIKFGDWRHIFFGLAFYAAIALSQLVLFVKSPATKVPHNKQNFAIHLFGSYGAVLSKLPTMPVFMCLGFCSANLFIFLTTSPFVYMEYFGVSEQQFPFFFGAGVISLMAMNLVNVLCLRRYQPIILFKFGVVVQFILVLAQYIYVSNFEVQLGPFLALLILVITMLGFIWSNGLAIYLEYFPKQAGTANALVGIWQFSFAGIAGVTVNWLHDDTLMPVASIMLASTSIGMLMIIIFMQDKHSNTAKCKIASRIAE
jgi:DHA1 family bicyclomycin/chloramphenicol resistance-like MFS transporter